MPKINESLMTDKPSEIQSVIFDAKIWNKDKAEKWLKENDFSGLIADEESNGDYIRYRQHNPNRYERFRTIESGKDGIKFVIGFTKIKKQVDDIANNITNDIDFEAVRLYCKKLLIEDGVSETIIYLLEQYDKNDWIKISNVLSKVFYDKDYKDYEEAMSIKLVKHNEKEQKCFNGQFVKLLKGSIDDEKRLIYGVVIEPKNIDTDNQWTDEKEIENACHVYMKFFQESGIDHTMVVEKGLKIVENYIAPSNLDINGVKIKKGSWIMVHYVENDEIWERIKNGDLTGYSFEGLGILTTEKLN